MRWRSGGSAVLACMVAVASCSLDGGNQITIVPSGTDATTTTVPTTTVPTTTVDACPDPSAALERASEPTPIELREAVDSVLADPRWSTVDASVSVWIEGYGEVAQIAPDRLLNPASNQKLYTAFGALSVLDPDHRFETRVMAVDDTLVLVAGGDPTLTRRGPHSLAALADLTVAALADVPARLAVDASHFEAATRAGGWQDWQTPTYVGPLSALTVDDNRWRTDETFLADPATANAEAFAAELSTRGVSLEPEVRPWTGQLEGPVLAAVYSAPVDDLVASMLQQSDNETAEALLREIGGGATAEGITRVDDALATWCLPLAGRSGDGSGLSRDDWRSAREWRRLLQLATDAPWFERLHAALPTAGRTGTLANRLTGEATRDNVHAKTGSIIGGRALSGYATTVNGRAVVFSAVTNGEPEAARSSRAAIDSLIETVVSNG